MQYNGLALLLAHRIEREFGRTKPSRRRRSWRR
jgi:hypothetical protein